MVVQLIRNQQVVGSIPTTSFEQKSAERDFRVLLFVFQTLFLENLQKIRRKPLTNGEKYDTIETEENGEVLRILER